MKTNEQVPNGIIHCPKCGEQINVSGILSQEIQMRLSQEFEAKLAEERTGFDEREKALLLQHQKIAEREKTIEETIERESKRRAAERESEIRESVARQSDETYGERLKALQTEIADKSAKVKELSRAQAEIERLKREKDELREEILAESEKKRTEEIAALRENIRKDADEKIELKLAERDKKIEDLRVQLQESQRRLEQGSAQLSGEVQELAIEEWLLGQFPLDDIEEVRKGAQGADCLQSIHTREHANCGSIYYESKRTKTFQPAWLEKFKNDIRERNASVGVIVTETLPAGMERLGLIDGIWVCTFDEFKGLAHVLRESVIRISQAAAAQEGRDGKMDMLYNYLTGNEFQGQLQAIVEGFTQMQSDLDSEKRSVQSQWKKREKQIDKVLLSTTSIYGSVRGIAGSSVKEIVGLESPREALDGETSPSEVG